MLPDSTYQEAFAWLSRRPRLLLLSHQRPDGDALGSLVGLTRALAARGATACAALFDEFPERYAYLERAIPWWSFEDLAPIAGEFDGLIVVDTAAPSQLEPALPFLNGERPPLLLIDHHAAGDRLTLRDSDHAVIDSSAAAASLLVTEFIDAVQGRLDAESAAALFTGVATDTGWFRFSNADARTLRCAARLIDAGAEPAELYRRIYEHDTPERLSLIARLFDSLEMHVDGALAVVTVKGGDIASVGGDMTLASDLINEVARLQGIEAILMFTEQQDGRVRVNLRSKRWLNVAALAGQFGGGGHERAAGARVEGELADVKARVTAAAERLLNEGP